MSGPLAGKVALVSGATRGGGRGIAVALGEAGATVYASGRSTRERRSEVDRPETIEETAELVSAAGGEGIAGRVRPLVLAALVASGAAVVLTAGSALLGELRPGELTAAGWGWLACLAAISTVAAISLFFAGLKRVGPTTASILATVEPLVTVVLAFLVFGERLGAVQLAGGALVLVAVLVLHAQWTYGSRRMTA